MPDAHVYYRPLAQTDAAMPADAFRLAGGPTWFNMAERLQRGQAPDLIAAGDIPAQHLSTLTAARAPLCGLTLDRPRLMGILNTTPDSFSDGGRFNATAAALDHAETLITQGCDIVDVGGESTRPGSDAVDIATETGRTQPVLAALTREHSAVLSVDTRKAAVAQAALAAGAVLINDVSALTYDPAMLELVKSSGAAVCLMHASGDPKTMQDDPRYDDVLLDVYDYLHDRVETCVAAGIARDRIAVDPGIGFGKKNSHNLALIRGLSLFHGLGCAVLLGVSRKKFIGTIGGEPQADRRAPGSIALALEAVRQGVHILRVHDIRETKQALALWQAAR